MTVSQSKKHADMRDPFFLLRTRHQRPRRRAAKSRDELAPPCMSGKEHGEG
jgi:hypothetical protein